MDDLRDREGSKGPSSGDAKTVGKEAECGMTGLPDGEPVTPTEGRYSLTVFPKVEVGDPIGISLEKDDDLYLVCGDEAAGTDGSGFRRLMLISVMSTLVLWIGLLR
jgi:hypothetical protein